MEHIQEPPRPHRLMNHGLGMMIERNEITFFDCQKPDELREFLNLRVEDEKMRRDAPKDELGQDYKLFFISIDNLFKRVTTMMKLEQDSRNIANTYFYEEIAESAIDEFKSDQGEPSYNEGMD